MNEKKLSVQEALEKAQTDLNNNTEVAQIVSELTGLDTSLKEKEAKEKEIKDSKYQQELDYYNILVDMKKENTELKFKGEALYQAVTEWFLFSFLPRITFRENVDNIVYRMAIFKMFAQNLEKLIPLVEIKPTLEEAIAYLKSLSRNFQNCDRDMFKFIRSGIEVRNISALDLINGIKQDTEESSFNEISSTDKAVILLSKEAWINFSETSEFTNLLEPISDKEELLSGMLGTLNLTVEKFDIVRAEKALVKIRVPVLTDAFAPEGATFLEPNEVIIVNNLQLNVVMQHKGTFESVEFVFSDLKGIINVYKITG